MEEREQASETSARVQEVAASVQQASTRRRRISGSKAETVARRYFEAIAARDVDVAVGMWAEGGRENVRGQVDTLAPEGVREFIGGFIAAMPDLKVEILSSTTEDERCGIHWRMSGTFAGAEGFSGIAPTGDHLELEGFDLITVRDGRIQSNDAFSDSMTFARQIGMMPPDGSSAEARMTGAFNAKTRIAASMIASEPGLVAEGVWLVQGQPGRCNVYLIEEQGQVTVFDAGARTMTRSIASAAARLGGIRRIVLGHGHTDHRGSAPGLGAPVICHPAEVLDAEGSGGFRYWPQGLKGLPLPLRQIHKLMHRLAWDGGPVKISGTVSEGDEVAGFTVIEIPGHAPGQIALWRESDRLALSSDCFYTVDMLGRESSPHLPDAVYNYDTGQARASLRKLAALQPAAAWPGHARPLTGDVRGQLERAADAG
jgi:glyoxylase-like metal-dependent hydrolase (beta-lactamase superfamily II)/predicted ester cyclase